jgi:hypothetical protein
MKTRKGIIFSFSLSLLITFPTQLFSWAPITHISVLRDVIKDKDSRLNPDIKRILDQNISYAQGGALGPDLFNSNRGRF